VRGEKGSEEPEEGEEAPTEKLSETEEAPTEKLSGEEEQPTEKLAGADEAPTGKLGAGGEAPTDRLDPGGEAPTEPRESWAPHQPEVKSGTGILAASILASIALIVAYIFAGGLDFKPTPVADPCDSRVWSDPSGLEDTAQQLAFSTLDGAACDLGVSREALTRALASDQATEDFLAENEISREQFDEAIRSGLERAVDDAEAAGAIDPLVASAIRTALQVLPVSQLIPLIQEASSAVGSDSTLQDLLNGDTSGLGDLLGGDSGLGGLFGEDSALGDLLQQGLDALGGGSSGDQNPGQGGGSEGGSGSGGLGDLVPPELEQQLRDQLPPEIERNLPPGIEDGLGRELQRQLEGLLGSTPPAAGDQLRL
jgi:hypothetical protein